MKNKENCNKGPGNIVSCAAILSLVFSACASINNNLRDIRKLNSADLQKVLAKIENKEGLGGVIRALIMHKFNAEFPGLQPDGTYIECPEASGNPDIMFTRDRAASFAKAGLARASAIAQENPDIQKYLSDEGRALIERGVLNASGMGVDFTEVFKTEEGRRLFCARSFDLKGARNTDPKVKPNSKFAFKTPQEKERDSKARDRK